jgi:hypothetical protein
MSSGSASGVSRPCDEQVIADSELPQEAATPVANRLTSAIFAELVEPLGKAATSGSPAEALPM